MQSRDLQTEFAGRRGALFRLALKTSLLTVLTLGVYRFWMKTRLRRYYWSSVRPGGVPLEYTGTPREKLLGFLIAVVFLAFYIGIVNLILMFLSFSLFHENFTAYLVSFVGVVPIWFYAQYRARRYVLARTRWRGLRFGLEPGAWGYAWRALGHWLATILTLGLLWPWMTFGLEKYRTDRTFFGTARLHQGGTWGMLFPKLRHVVFGVALAGAGGLLAAAGWPLALWLLLVAVPWAVYGFVYYRVESFRLLTDHKTAGQVGLRARPRPGRVLRLYLLGTLIIVLSLLALLFAFRVGAGALLAAVPGGTDIFQRITDLLQQVPTWLTAGIAVLLYFGLFVLWGVLTHVFLTLPLTRHYAETLELTGAPHLAGIHQRDRDDFTEAEGFAEALDVGAAI